MADIKASDYVKKYDGVIEDNLNSISVLNALSANQGKVLNEKFANYVPTTRKIGTKTLSDDISLTGSDVGLGNVTNDAQIKKITSSTDDTLVVWDGTTGDKVKNSTIDISKVVTTEGSQTLTNKTLTTPSIPSIVNGANTLTIPSKTGTVAVTSDIPSFESTTTNIKMNGTQSLGTLNTVAKADHIHPSDTSKVNKIASSVDNNLMAWSGTTGDVPKDSGISSSKVVTTDGSQTLTNKTLTNPTLVTPNSYYCYLPSTTSNDTLVTTNTSQTLSNKTLLGGAFTVIVDNTNSTKKAFFNCGNISSNTIRAYNLPDADGTIALVSTLINQIYPVGHILMTENSANPSTYLGVGTWVAYGSGKVPVGIDTLDTDFNTVGKIGGEKTHKLITSEIPSHNHANGNFNRLMQVSGSNTAAAGLDSSASEVDLYAQGVISSVGGDQPHNNLSPYIVCYMWKRTI